MRVKEQRNVFKLTIIVVIFLMFIIVFYSILTNGLINTHDSQIPSKNEEYPEKTLINVTFDSTFKLNGEFHKYEIDEDVRIIFSGEKSQTDSTYLYIMAIMMGDKVVQTPIFNNFNDRVIMSSDAGASVRVLKINDLYVFISNLGEQFNGNYIAVVNKEREVLCSFKYVGVNLDLINNKMELSRCIYKTADEECLSITYKFVEENIELIETQDIS